ncbi:ATP-binding protein [Pseudomonas sp. PS01301]|uniref:AAA family ATPase n=1 Tax=Pseudomonas sp. PS01301 TaxID=2991437 RepID=UPI002499BE37|nr:ATP-binding protein [Pseudomonas sp. PS01301]
MSDVKITKIEITNYRSCVATKFYPNKDLSVLIGPNGSGKTTVLSAFQLLTKLVNVSHRRSYHDTSSIACGLKVVFIWNGYPITYEAKVNLVNNERNEDEIQGAVETWYAYSITGSKKKIVFPLNALGDAYSFGTRYQNPVVGYFAKNIVDPESARKLTTAITEIAGFVSEITYYSASVFTNPSTSPISFEVESESGNRRVISITGHKKFLYDLYMSYKANDDDYQNFIDVVGSNGAYLIDDLTFLEVETSSSIYKVLVGGKLSTKQKKNNLVIPNFIIQKSSLSPSQLSEGTFKALALIFYIITNHGSLMLIEEPEVCVHHGLLYNLIDLIKIYSQEKQIIISTHSDQLLDKVEMRSVFKVIRGEDGTKVSSVRQGLNFDELNALKDYLANEGGLGEYWKHGDL